MSKNEENTSEVVEQEKQTTNDFWLKLTVIVAIVVGLYFIMSPYQNCMREVDRARYCLMKTSW